MVCECVSRFGTGRGEEWEIGCVDGIGGAN